MTSHAWAYRVSALEALCLDDPLWCPVITRGSTVGYLPWWVLMSSLVPIVTVSSHSVSSRKIGMTTTVTGILRACRRLDQR